MRGHGSQGRDVACLDTSCRYFESDDGREAPYCEEMATSAKDQELRELPVVREREQAEEARAPVLSVFDLTTVSLAAIERAAILAHALELDLDLVGVLTSSWRSWDGLPQARAQLAAAIADLPAGSSPGVNVSEGSVTGVAIANGIVRRPAIVVLSPDAGGDGYTAVAIANVLGVPVLVARATPSRGPVVAATSMTHSKFPVLAAAARLARQLVTPAAFVHNAFPYPFAGVDPIATQPRADDGAKTNLATLRGLAGRFGEDIEAIVVRSHSVLDAIVGIAETHQAGVVAIGSPRRKWFDRHRSKLTEELVDRCPCSVFVVPVPRS